MRASEQEQGASCWVYSSKQKATKKKKKKEHPPMLTDTLLTKADAFKMKQGSHITRQARSTRV